MKNLLYSKSNIQNVKMTYKIGESIYIFHHEQKKKKRKKERKENKQK